MQRGRKVHFSKATQIDGVEEHGRLAEEPVNLRRVFVSSCLCFLCQAKIRRPEIGYKTTFTATILCQIKPRKSNCLDLKWWFLISFFVLSSAQRKHFTVPSSRTVIICPNCSQEHIQASVFQFQVHVWPLRLHQIQLDEGTMVKKHSTSVRVYF